MVLKAFSKPYDEKVFFENANGANFVYIDRLLDDGELCCLYSKTDIHVNVPISDALGGGVIEPIQFGSVPVLSDLKPYRDLLAITQGSLLESESDQGLERAISTAESLAKQPIKSKYSEYSATTVVSNVIDLYEKVIGRRTT